MDGNEEIVNPQEEQQQEQVEKPQRKTISQHVEQFRDTVNDAGKTIETVGKAEEKLGNMIGGGEKAGKAAATTGSAVSSAADAGAQAMKASGKATEATGKATEAAGKATEAVGKATEAGGKAMKATGKGVEAAGQGVSAAGSTPYTAALKPVGEAMKAGGKGTQAAGTGVEAAGKAEQATGKAEQAAGKAEQAAGKAEQAAAEATEAAAKTGKAASEVAKKPKDKSLADKLRERGKLNQARGKRLQEQAKKFDSDEYFNNVFDKLGKGGKVLKGIIKSFDPKVVGVVSLLIITIGTLFVTYILSPLFFMNLVKETVGDPDNIEKVNNYLSGLGFQDSEDAFYEEVDYLNTHYGKQLDFPYIMATLYYTDIYYGDTGFYVDDNKDLCGSIFGTDKCDGMQLAYQLAKYYIKESQTTTGQDGLVYSASKLYRLRDLAKHQFLGATTPKSATLDEYVKMCIERMDNETKKVIQYFPLLMLYIITRFDPIVATLFDTIMVNTAWGEVIADLVEIFTGTESWNSIMLELENGTLGNFITSVINFGETFLNCFFNVKGISFNFKYTTGEEDEEESDEDKPPLFMDVIAAIFDSSDSDSLIEGIGKLIKVEYYDYTFSEEKFESYLIDDYIRKMPEFSKLLVDEQGNPLTGDELNKKIDKIGFEIRQVKDTFDKMYQLNESAQQKNNCIGDINLDLLAELETPVKLSVGQVITFDENTNYGLVKGIMHNGVDLQADTTNTNAGDEVYSVYTGTVYESTADDTYSDKTARGGWLVIDYDVQFSDSNYGNGVISKMFKNKISSIKVFYGGLSPDSVKLKKGDIVNKGDVIGTVGDASASEDGNTPSVHFGIYDTKLKLFLNPVNMFITCKRKGKGGASSCSNGGTTLEIPDSVFELNQTNYTITFYDERGFGSLGIDGSSPQKKVHQLWLDDGLRYKNGIAIVNVDGTDRYLAAITKNFGVVGDLVYANLEDGTALPLIVADEKDYDNTDNGYPVENKELCMSPEATDPACYGHLKGSSLSVIEFEFDNQYLYEGFYSATQLEQDWNTNQKVISISNCGSATD